jgi:Arc/MetJ-type ribon-helix-helix transcriptional regulator
MSYNADVGDRTISVRLDDEAARALDHLTANGRSKSDAVRDSLLAAARLDVLEQARLETEAIAADEADRREKAEVLALMESLREKG